MKLNPNLVRLAELTHNPDLKVNTSLVQKIADPNISGEFDVKDPENYVQLYTNGLYEKKEIISKFELPGYNNMNYEDTHIKLLGNKLYMPTPKTFMHFFNKVVDAYKNKTPILNAENSRLTEEEIKDIYLHLTTNHKAMYDPQKPGAWTWLNAQFSEIDGNWSFSTKMIDPTTGNLMDIIRDLSPCIRKDCYVNLSNLNDQGLATVEHNTQKYVQGKNIYYFHPRDGAVAGFFAYSVWAGLSCDRDPQYSDSGLGVFGCAEGA